MPVLAQTRWAMRAIADAVQHSSNISTTSAAEKLRGRSDFVMLTFPAQGVLKSCEVNKKAGRGGGDRTARRVATT